MNRGFTLIELLAVMVILAIIALIATPAVLNIIDSTRIEAIKRSVERYGEALNNELMRLELTGENFILEDIDKKLKYEGSKVECRTKKLLSNNTIYLENCFVNGEAVEYTFGSKKRETAPTITTGNVGQNKIIGYTLPKSGNGGLDIYANISEGTILKYSKNGGSEVTVAPVKDDNGNTYFPIALSLAEGTYPLAIKLYSNNVVVDSLTTSVKEYCATVLNNSDYAENYELVKAFVYASNAVQVYFNTNPSDLIGSILPNEFDVSSYDIPINLLDTIKIKEIEGGITDLNRGFNSNINYGDIPRFIMYFTMLNGTTINDYKVFYKGSELSKQLDSKGRIQINIPMSYKDLDSFLEVRVEKGNESMIARHAPLYNFLNGTQSTTVSANIKMVYITIVHYWEVANRYYYG